MAMCLPTFGKIGFGKIGQNDILSLISPEFKSRLEQELVTKVTCI